MHNLNCIRLPADKLEVWVAEGSRWSAWETNFSILFDAVFFNSISEPLESPNSLHWSSQHCYVDLVGRLKHSTSLYFKEKNIQYEWFTSNMLN